MSGFVSAAPTPTSCPPSCSCHHILPSLGQRTLEGGHGLRTRLWHPFPPTFKSRVEPLPFAPGLAPGTLAPSLEQASASTARDNSVLNSAPPQFLAQRGTCLGQSPPSLASTELSVD